ncbi:hypothetical protein HOLleu_10043 [Holothuria leucospilota]|uniref:Uncharacterized protein n=1 Tax=Holothuria leucospilota TaxID=206669 RepID=A0A9Q1HFE9_HOLLE|nr:hypothetical protein HOLleu_10043 [Holothuria leucospilota]
MLNFFKFRISLGWDNIDQGGKGFLKTANLSKYFATFVPKCPIIFVQDCLSYHTRP